MNHAIKEQISDNTLYVEVEPQLFFDNGFRFVDKPQYFMSAGWLVKNHSPISIGDTVYQGEEWIDTEDGPIIATDSCLAEQPGAILSPQTMPIELADKTFKVVEIEVEERETAQEVQQSEEELEIERRHALKAETSELVDKWFWKYSLEEI